MKMHVPSLQIIAHRIVWCAVFVVGYLLIYLLAVKLDWFPVQGYQYLSNGFAGWLHRLILPALPACAQQAPAALPTTGIENCPALGRYIKRSNVQIRSTITLQYRQANIAF